MAQVQLPVGSTQQQTLKVVEKVENYFLTEEKNNVLSVFATVGSGPGGNGQNVARLFIRLADWINAPPAPIPHSLLLNERLKNSVKLLKRRCRSVVRQQFQV